MSLSWNNRHFADLRKKEEEDKDRKKKWAFAMKKKEQEEAKEHRRQITNFCPRCHITLTISGGCMMGCGYQK